MEYAEATGNSLTVDQMASLWQADCLDRIANSLSVIADAAMQDESGEEEEEGGYTSLSDH
jgi:hypothetical protein